MGLLAGNTRKTKISHDPNNTKWARDTTTFGQKILRSQGWEPGQYLGAQDAGQQEFHTAANATFIRVSLKDDMKGLGFDKAKDNEVTGLDVFSDLLSRLNGKSAEAVAEDQLARMVVKTNKYVEQKYGAMRFVRGGLLVGDELKDTSDESEKATNTPVVEEVAEPTKKDKKDRTKKRKAAAVVEEAGETVDSDSDKAQSKRKRRRKADDNDDESDAGKSKSSKKDKRRKKDKSRSEGDDAEEDEQAVKKSKSKKKSSPEEDDSSLSKKERKEKKKQEKRDRKEKEKKKKSKRSKEDVSDEEEEEESAEESSSAKPSAVATPSDSRSGTSTPQGSRNFARSRYIAQKRQAVLDAKALNQIFMIKA